MKKKFLPVLLSLALCAAMVPATSFADQAQAEALYQTEADGEWQAGSFDEALSGVYVGGTIKLTKDAARAQCANLERPVTITSADPSKPCKIYAKTNQHGCLLNVDADKHEEGAAGVAVSEGAVANAGGVTLENVIVDGGSEEGLTAKQAAVVVTSGRLTLGEGAVIRNNANTSRDGGSQSGFGGGIYVDKGTLVAEGGLVAGNAASVGGGVFVSDGTFIMKDGTIASNTAQQGGGVCVGNSRLAGSHAVLKLSGGSIVGNATGNKSGNYGGGVYCVPGCEVRLSGAPVIADNASYEETCGGIYLNGAGANADVIIEGALTSRAKVMFFACLEKNNFVVAVPESGYTITSADMGQLHYAGQIFALKLNEAGNVILYKADYVIAATAHGNGSISPSGKMGAFKGDSIEFTITPDEGYLVKDVIVDGRSAVVEDAIGNEQSGAMAKTCVLENIQSSVDVDAYFEEVPSDGAADGEGGNGGGSAGGATDGDGSAGGATDGTDDSATPPNGSSDSDPQAPAASRDSAGVASTGDALGVAAAVIAGVAVVAAAVALLARRRGGRS